MESGGRAHRATGELARREGARMRRNVIIVLALAWALSGCALGLIEAARQNMQSTEAEAKDQRLADLGHAALLSGNYGLAEAYLEAALEINPDNPYALHNLGVVYYNTNRTDKARELYAKLVAFDPSGAATAASQDESALDVERATQIRLDPGATAGAPPPNVAPNVALDVDRIIQTRLDPGAAAGAPPPNVAPNVALNVDRITQSRLGPGATAGGEPGGKVDLAVLDRFTTLARLRDAGLISRDEYEKRRGANLGALAPLTGPPPSPVLARPALPARDVIERLRTITALRAAGALNAAEFATERTAILDALMPATRGPKRLAAAPPGAAGQDHSERAALMARAGSASPPTAAIEAEPVPPPPGDKPRAVHTASAAHQDEPATRDGPGSGVHVASYRTPERARRGWDVLRAAHGDVLEGLKPRIARVDLGPDTGVFFRLRAGPLADEAAAWALCQELKHRDLYCAPSVY
jgi:hypothetical protein